MTDKVNGVAGAAESLTGNMDFFLVETLVNIQGDGVIGHTAQDVYDQLIEIISQKAQPVLLTAVTTRTAIANEPGFLGTSVTAGGETVYGFHFAVEHSVLWVESGATDPKAESLVEAFDGAGNGAIIGDGVNNNIRVVFSAVLN